MRCLIIATPSALNEGRAHSIIQAIESRELKIVGLKAELLDICGIEKKAKNEKDPDKKSAFEAQLKVPCILIAVEGASAISAGKEIQKEFGDFVHSSSSQEIAAYEITRFFKKEEIFLHEKIKQWVE